MSSHNYLRQTLIGTALVIASLLALSVIPEFDFAGFHFKRVIILADVLKKEKVVVQDTIAMVIKPVYADTCRQGVTCVEDYSKDSTGLDAFLAALDSSKNHKVRIAWFGDSYVEGDILLDPLRDTLQALFGGNGVGFVPITSEVAGFRQTVIHSFGNWKTYAIVGEKSDEHPLGPAGYAAVPLEGNRVSYTVEKRKRLNIFPSAKLFYGNADSATLIANDKEEFIGTVKSLHTKSLGENLAGLKLSVKGQADLYGVTFEDKTGIAVDNFAMRGNSGIGLHYVNEKMYRDFDSLHHYDLVILSYGLNVANEKSKNYEWYVRSMKPTIAMMRRAFPNSSIIVLGCSDRADNIDGEMQTMPSVKRLIQEQRKMAADNNVCFWDLQQAMGGDSTMIRWAELPKRPLANKDYTHLTFSGGKKVAEIFLNTILYERDKYERRKRSR
ncbi:MAG TPA: hypothetical protein VK174_00290 [Chitinophagales bacterium]|nr:hypothetical protein [Chitinophagales bacterium]